MGVTHTVRVPDPVYRRLTQQANRSDVSRGAIIREWMEAADTLEEVQRR